MPGKILIVEDNDDIRDALEALLTFDGFEVLTASDGVEGLAKASAAEPDLIITDFNMPNLDGAQLIRLIRHNSKLAWMPIIVVTAYPIDGFIAGDSKGPNVVLRKPVAHELLLETIGRVIHANPSGRKIDS